ncbi:hypothetical protein [Marinomonas sp. IMCC 4694]|uniref:hypothetical protein n=1 Tax=Marinomonas sp. IMCC 4694 TaxID=2605432 RepID=UPI0011E6C883|nr:hypothetical protein [Marinomonas sp. IMCC 4694]TYL47086.1 hypothetical protein FXV75_03500 [Marinomonas sp. IMCC 4694]
MLFIEALNKASPQPHEKKPFMRGKYRSVVSNKDSVDLSTAAHQVKEIRLNSKEKTPLTASISIFANLVEHVLLHIIEGKVQLLSPEELNVDSKEWSLSLQVPPVNANPDTRASEYLSPEKKRPQPIKSLVFHIPVKPIYGPPIEMTLLVSPHYGSPKVPDIFRTTPKENWLPTLRTPYLPDVLHRQLTHHHILLDQDGEPDQLSPLYLHAHQTQPIDTKAPLFNIDGLRVWRVKNTLLAPIALGDHQIGLLFVGHHKPLGVSQISKNHSEKQINNLNTKA